MANIEGKPTGSGKEIALLVGVLMLVVAGTIGTYWVRTQGAEASGKTAAATPTETSRPRVSAPAPTATDGEVVHADVYFDFKSTRLRADAAVGACRRRFKNLPERHFRALEFLVRQHLERRPPTDTA